MMENEIGFIATAFIMCSYVPQIIKCIKSGKSDDLSLLMIAFSFLGNAAWALNAWMTGNTPLQVSAVIMMLLCLPLAHLKISQSNTYPIAFSARRVGRYACFAALLFIL